MKSQKLGENISGAEVQQISPHGLWLYVNGKEYFLSFKQFPWFKEAKVSEICHVKLLFGHHLHWPDLDVDLELESINRWEKYPLIYKG
jgi:hypothetical protein